MQPHDHIIIVPILQTPNASPQLRPEGKPQIPVRLTISSVFCWSLEAWFSEEVLPLSSHWL